MKAIIDSVILIGAFYKRDQWHDLAVPIVLEMEQGNIHGIITEYILSEVLTFLKRRSGLHAAKIVHDTLFESDILDIVYLNQNQFMNGLTIFISFPHLSVVDATSIAIMRDLNIRDIYSFDSDFDIIEGIVRHESLARS